MNNPNIFKIKFIFIAVFIFMAAPMQNSIARQALDKIIVIVNDDVITQSELDLRVEDFIVQLKLNRNSKEEIEALTKQVLDRMIVTRIQLQMAKKMGITIDDISLNRMIEKIAKSNNLTINKLKETLSKEGIQFSRFREQTRTDVIVKQLQQRMVANKITISDQEIQQFIDKNINKNSKNEKYKVQHILISIPESASPEDLSKAEKKANQLFEKIKEGSNFKTLAIQHSNGRNAFNGGDLGWRTSSELPDAFIAAIKDLRKGETAAPIRSASGFHILKLIDSSASKTMITQTLARHILIKADNDINDNEAQQLLNKLKQRIQQGEKFSTIASEYSQDPGSKIKGGNLGWADPGAFVPEFEEVMNDLKKNEISDPFRSQFGWHILQVMDRRQRDKTLSSLKSKANQEIHKRKYDEELRLWMRRIRNEAYVEYIGNKPE